MSLLKFQTEFKEPLAFADFDTKALKKGFRKVGMEVRKIARKMVSKRALSSPGGNPGKVTGKLQKSIDYRVSRSGFSVAVANQSKGLDEFYPAYVYYGHVSPKGALRRKSGKRIHDKNPGKKVAAPRNNYIKEAAEQYGQSRYMAVMSGLLREAIKPGLIGGTVK